MSVNELSPELSVVIVNWNTGAQLGACLDSLAGDAALDIVVVDNGSVDGSEHLAAGRQNVMLIQSHANLGFGKACNLGASHARGDFFLFLNPDAAVYPETLEKVVSFMRNSANSRFGICGVQLSGEDGVVARTCTRFPSATSFLFHSLGMDRLFPRGGYFMSEWRHDESRAVDHVIGAFYFVRREVFEALSGFDERFFVYLEDLDFSLRAKRAGWESFYLADAQAFHAGGGASRQIKARRLFYSLRSRLLYVVKNFNISGVATVFIATLLVEPFSRSVFAISRGSWLGVKETWHGYAMLWAWLPQWLIRGVTR